MSDLLDDVWILPALMAGSFLVILFFGKRIGPKATIAVGTTAVAVCLGLSLLTAAGWISRVDGCEHAAEEGEVGEGCAPAAHSSEGAAAEEGHGEGGGEGEGTGTGADEDHSEGAPATEEGAVAPGESAGAPVVARAFAGEGHVAFSTVPVETSWTWFQSGGIEFSIGFIADGLSIMMLFTVSFISLLVHIYSIEYLHDDRRFTHYYAFLSLFTASMLFYVISNNSLQMLVGWELVGLCSFGLIGHWWEEQKNSDAALKAFLTNRVGDTGLILGVVITFFAAGATSFNVLHLNEYALSGAANQTLLLVGALCLFAGVTSKSGQFPLHTWLPDAMAGPTPVSALIHAATMVVAGVYLIARLYAVFFEGVNIGPNAINYVAFIGGFTTVMGGALAFVQHDLKKVLAYSTVSQLGYMVMALGVGAWTAGIFHLFTHAFFKACLFLGAGSVSHACHHTFDMREMGGLRKHMPVTHATFLIATLALAGIFPFAGFWSKDEILVGALEGQETAYHAMLAMGLVTAFLTACYMGRAYWMTFWGEYRGHGTPHESPKVMTVPLMILAGFAAVLGLANFPWGLGILEGHRFEHYVQPTFAFPAIEVAEFNPALAGVSLLLAGAGLAVAFLYYEKNLGPHGLTAKNKVALAGYQFLENKYYLDDLYEGVVVAFVKGPLARAAYWFNQHVLDAVVDGVGAGARGAGKFVYRNIDQGVVDRAVNASGAGSEGLGQALRRMQTGKVQQYGALLFGGALVLAAIFVFTV